MVKSPFILCILILFSFFCFQKTRADPLCTVLLTPPDEDFYAEAVLTPTERLTAYLNQLIDQGAIGDIELSSLISGLRRGEVINPFQDQGSSLAEIHQGGINEYIGVELNQDQLLRWVRERLTEKKRVQIERDKARGGTQDFHQKIEFHPVTMGRFEMGSGNEKVPVHLTYPIEVMSTQVTQKHWVELMGKNPSRFQKGEHTVSVFVDGERVHMQPDHPVENVTWWSTLIFANRLSEKHGFTPTYDLSGINWDEDTSAEKGGLVGERGAKVKIRVDGESHDPSRGDLYYQTEGYRLPTEAEQEYLLRASGIAIEGIHCPGDKGNVVLQNYAWFAENSGGKPHPVAGLRPAVYGDKDFYDLYGNVSEWSWDTYNDKLKGGRDPVQSKEFLAASLRLHRSGSWKDQTPFLKTSLRCFLPPFNRLDTIGFRLVRTIGRP